MSAPKPRTLEKIAAWAMSEMRLTSMGTEEIMLEAVHRAADAARQEEREEMRNFIFRHACAGDVDESSLLSWLDDRPKQPSEERDMMTSQGRDVVEAVIGGSDNIREAVGWALMLSTWFEVTPLSDDNYRIRISAEFKSGLDKYRRRYPANREETES